MRSRLLDAAARHFKMEGFGAVSLAQIAEEAGAYPSQITYYFRSKEALFVEAACREMLYLARQAEIASQAANTSDRYLEIMVRSVIGAPGLGLFLEALSLAHRRPELKPQVERTFERLDQESDRALREYRVRRGYPTNNTATPARRFWVIALGMGARGGAVEEPNEQLVKEMLALLRDGGGH